MTIHLLRKPDGSYAPFDVTPVPLVESGSLDRLIVQQRAAHDADLARRVGEFAVTFGTETERFSSDKPNLSNDPQEAAEYIRRRFLGIIATDKDEPRDPWIDCLARTRASNRRIRSHLARSDARF